jgi:hypothetical protein
MDFVVLVLGIATVRAWNAKTAAELFLLTGFADGDHGHDGAATATSTTTSALRPRPVHTAMWHDGALVTGHAKSITLHLFNIDTPTDFDLDMPEYRK